MGVTTLASAGVCVALCVALIPTMGLYGASLATLAAMFAVNEYRRVKVRAYVDLGKDLRERIATLGAAAVVFAFYYFAALTGSTAALVGCVAVAFAYFFVANRGLVARLFSYVKSRR